MALRPWVFLSYRHESDAHRAKVRQLAERLAALQIPVQLDMLLLQEHQGGPDEGWTRWSEERAEHSACVLIICSKGWFESYRGQGVAGQGRGSASEARIFAQEIHSAKGINKRFRLVIVDDFDQGEIPLALRPWQVFRPFDGETQFEQLVHWIRQRLSPRKAGGVVFLADAPASLQEARRALQSLLEESGWEVRHSGEYEPRTERVALETDIGDALAVLQLTGSGAPDPRARAQLEVAQRLGKTRVVLHDERAATSDARHPDADMAPSDRLITGDLASIGPRVADELARLARDRRRSTWLIPTSLTALGLALAAGVGLFLARIEALDAKNAAAKAWLDLKGETAIPIAYAARPAQREATHGAERFNMLQGQGRWLRNPAAQLYRVGLLLEANNLQAARAALDEKPACPTCVRNPFAVTDLPTEEWEFARLLLRAEIAFREDNVDTACEVLAGRRDPYSLILRQGVYDCPPGLRDVEGFLRDVERATPAPSNQALSWAYDTAAAYTTALVDSGVDEATQRDVRLRALRYYKMATDKYEDNANAWRNRADLELELTLLDDAIASFEKAGKITPLGALGAQAYGAALQKRGLRDSSSADLTAAVQQMRDAMDAPLSFEESTAIDGQLDESQCPGGIRPGITTRDRFEASILCSRAGVEVLIGSLANAQSDAQRGYEVCRSVKCAANLACAREAGGLYDDAAAAHQLARATQASVNPDRSREELYARRRAHALELAGRASEAATEWSVAEDLGGQWRQSFECLKPLAASGSAPKPAAAAARSPAAASR